MRNIFLWFYCLPISQAIFLIALTTLVYWQLRVRLGQHPLWKPGAVILLVCWLAVILLGTVGHRSAGEHGQPQLIPFYSYYIALNGGSRELFRVNFMNTVLFYPVGLLGCDVLPRRWPCRRKVLLTAVALLFFSIGIEYFQYRFSLGLVETDDVIHNFLGALTGGLIGAIQVRKRH